MNQILHYKDQNRKRQLWPRNLVAKLPSKEILEPPKATAALEWDTEQASEVIYQTA